MKDTFSNAPLLMGKSGAVSITESYVVHHPKTWEY